MEKEITKSITVKFDTKTFDILLEEITRKRAAGNANSLLDFFIIRLFDGVRSGKTEQVFKLKSQGSGN